MRIAKSLCKDAESIVPAYRIRIDRLGSRGKASLRRGGKMHHLRVRAKNARKRVTMLIDDTTVTAIELTTGEVLSHHLIEPDRNY